MEEQPPDPLCRQPEPAVAAGEFTDDEIPERNRNLLERFIDQLEIGCGVSGDVLLRQQAERRCREFFAETAQPVAAAHRARTLARNPEEVGDDHIAAGIQKFRHA